ncbi:MAG: ABC transporter permease [Propionibacteriaceae bacterium]|nr:ABC transporter permease [Propionibacteriaceae bacterium]
MSTMTEPEQQQQQGYAYSFPRVVRSEWIKMVTLRSTWWLLIVTVVVNIGFAAIMVFAEKWVLNNPDTVGVADQNLMLTVSVVSACGVFGQLTFVILSILIITNEFSSGMSRSTFAVVPRRSAVLVAKMVVISAWCVIVFGVSVIVSWILGYMALQGTPGIDLSLTSGTSVRIIGGFIIEMVLMALFFFALGVIIRSSAGAIGAAVGVIWILPILASLVTNIVVGASEPTGWRKTLVDVTAFLPTRAGSVITNARIDPSAVLGPWQGLGVLCGWAVIALVIAFLLTSNRDV